MASEALQDQSTGSSAMSPSQPLRNVVQASQSFVPKPFPPPALRDVPEEYIVSQVRPCSPYVLTIHHLITSCIVLPRVIGIGQVREGTGFE